MEKLRLNIDNEGYYSEAFIKGWKTGVEAQFKADVREQRPKGEWVGEGDGYADGGIVYDTWYCSKCDHCEEGEELALPNFCPNCGCDCRGDKE